MEKKGWRWWVGAAITAGGVVCALGDGAKRFNEWMERLNYEGLSVRQMRFSPDGTRLFGIENEYTPGRIRNWLSCWNSATGRLLWQAVVSPDLRGGAVSPDGATLVTTGRDDATNGGEIIAWNAADGKRLWRISPPAGDFPLDAAFSSEGKRLFVAYYQEIRVYDATRGSLLGVWKRQGKATGLLDTIRVLPDGKGVLVVSSVDAADSSPPPHKNAVQLWDARDGSLVRTYVSSTDVSYRADASPDGASILIAPYAENRVVLRDAATGASLRAVTLPRIRPDSPGNTVEDARFLTSRRIGITGQREDFYTWDTSAKTAHREYKPYTRYYNVVSLDGKVAAAPHFGNGYAHPPLATLYDATTGAKIRDVEGKAGW